MNSDTTSQDDKNDLGPPWTFPKIMVDTLPESKKEDIQGKQNKEVADNDE